MQIRRGFIRALALAATLPTLALPALAAGPFPDQPIKMVVAFGPGTGSDTIARILATQMTAILNSPVIVENKLGGGGVIGTEFVARAAPDGYTITLGTASSLGTTPLLNPMAKYKVDKDFAFIAGLAKSDYVFVTANSPEAPKTLQDLVGRMKAAPTSFASAGVGTITHLATEVLLQRAGTKATHIPYKGSGEVIAAISGGHVLFAADSPSATLPLIRAGKLRALAVTGPQRIASLPDVPTVAESGYPGFAVLAWWGLAAPAGTPPDIVRKLGDVAFKAMSAPEVTQQLKQMEIEPMLLGPDEFTAFVRKDTPFWTEFVRTANIKLAP
jgi:tripartite-type tricarboxylate transporter receptor subunit TctC